MSAYNNCSTIGPTIGLTTIEFEPGELSTVQEVAISSGYGTVTETSRDGQVATKTGSGAYYATTTPALLDFSVLGRCGKIPDYIYDPGNFSLTARMFLPSLGFFVSNFRLTKMVRSQPLSSNPIPSLTCQTHLSGVANMLRYFRVRPFSYQIVSLSL
jgi:hypothetical protein